MSRVIVDIRLGFGVGVAARVEFELADELAGVVEDADVAAGDEDGDGLAGVFASEADVVKSSLYRMVMLPLRSILSRRRR